MEMKFEEDFENEIFSEEDIKDLEKEIGSALASSNDRRILAILQSPKKADLLDEMISELEALILTFPNPSEDAEGVVSDMDWISMATGVVQSWKTE